MSYYLCQDCKHNNNGWCNVKRMNGLKKKGIIKCTDYEINAIASDGENRYQIQYKVYNIPGTNKGLEESFVYESDRDNIQDIEDYALEYLGEHFAPGNFEISYIGKVN